MVTLPLAVRGFLLSQGDCSGRDVRHGYGPSCSKAQGECYGEQTPRPLRSDDWGERRDGRTHGQ